MQQAEIRVIMSDPATSEVVENFVVTTKRDESTYSLAKRVREAIEQYEEVIED